MLLILPLKSNIILYYVMLEKYIPVVLQYCLPTVIPKKPCPKLTPLFNLDSEVDQTGNAESSTEPQCLRSLWSQSTNVYLQLSQHIKLGEEKVS